MMRDGVRQLVTLLNQFLAGQDQSRDIVDEITGTLVEHFYESESKIDAEVYEELITYVTMYTQFPSRDERYLYPPEVLSKEFEYVLRRLREEGELNGIEATEK